ncbi:MAG TPA: outer membrane beta-barrel protein [Bacteroidales bacterium]|nr:outer membrane beta-barrel protein [Bacteroidales bacterium]
MKKSLMLMVLVTAVLCQGFAMQSPEITVVGKSMPAEADSASTVTVIIGNDLFRFDDSDSIVIIKMGNRGLQITESPEGKKKFDIEKYDPSETEELEDYRNETDGDWHFYNYEERELRNRSGRNFRGHWAGFEIGFNNYMHTRSVSLPSNISYMDLDASNSNCFNFNFSQVNIGFSRFAGLVSGIGLNYNTYRFEYDNSIGIGTEGTVAEVIPDFSFPVKKSKFNVLYLNVPVLLEFQIPAGYSNRLSIAAGVIGGLRLKSWTKVLYENDEKFRSEGDYNLNMLRGGVTGRIGFSNLTIFGTYFLTPWFEDLKGPDGHNLEPFEIGLAFTFND